jgi:hypothetical protein
MPGPRKLFARSSSPCRGSLEDERDAEARGDVPSLPAIPVNVSPSMPGTREEKRSVDCRPGEIGELHGYLRKRVAEDTRHRPPRESWRRETPRARFGPWAQAALVYDVHAGTVEIVVRNIGQHEAR